MTNQTDPDRLYYPSLVAEGIEARRASDASQWRLGDLALQVETSYREQTLEKYAADIGVEFNTLQDYRRVAAAYKKSDRSDFLTWTHYQRVAANKDRLDWLARAEAEGWSTQEMAEAMKNATGTRPHVSNNSGEDEWYTPAEFIEAARIVLGAIDLDPASSEEANAVVQAADFFDVHDDGLSREWHGNVWMNPPYSSLLIGRFAEKLVHHFQRRDVSAAIVLVNNATETEWFGILSKAASAMCLPERRIRFWSPRGEAAAPLQGQALLYLGGDQLDLFIEQYGGFGTIWVPA